MARSFSRASSQNVATTSPPVTAAPFTVGGWIKRGNSATTQNIFGLGTTSALKFFGISLADAGGGSYRLRAQHFDGTNNGLVTGTTAIAVGDRAHACAVFTSTSSRTLYVNGVSEGTDTTGVINAFTPNVWDFGTLDIGGTKTDYFEGEIAEWAVWDVALDAAEVAALGKGVSPLLIRPQSLKAYWPFLDAAVPDLDRWRAGVNLTPNASPTMAEHPRMFYPTGPRGAPAANGYTLDATFGTYTITGVAASFRRALRLSTAIGSYALTGTAAALKSARKLAAAIGSYAITGTAATLFKSIRMVCAIGAYAVTGTAASLKKAWRLISAIGAYVITGGTPSLRKSTPSTITLIVNGTDVGGLVDFETIRKEENPSGRSSNLTFTYYGDTPLTEGHEIYLYRSIATIEFGGTVLKCKQFYDKIRHNIGYRITCQDFNWLFKEERYIHKWAGSVSGTTIATDIVGFKTGFSAAGVEAGLASVDDFEIIWKTRAEALTMLQARLEGAQPWRVGYDKVVNFRVTPAVVALPDDITDLSYSGDELTRDSDLGQVRTRQRGLGVRVRIPIYVPAGSTAIAVDAVDRLPASGQLLVGSRLLAFSAQSQAQSVSGLANILGAPTVALASAPAGGVLGAVRYCITAETPNGETPLGTQSSQVTGATLAAPSAGSANVQHQNGVGVSSGDYYVSTGVTFSRSGTRFSFSLSNAVPGCRVYIFATSSGVYDGAWTVTDVSGGTAYVDGISSSAPSSETGNLQVITDGPLVSGGTYSYKFGWLSRLGISALSSAFTVSPAAVAATESATAGGTTGGNLTLTSTYYYYYTPYTEGAEGSPLALLGSAYTLTGGNNAITLSFTQLSSSNGWHDLRVRGLRLYRGKAGEQLPRLVADFSRATLAALGAFGAGWSYTDTAADTSLGALPRSGVMGGAVGITSLPSWADSRVIGLMILRTIAGGSDYYPVATINSAAVTGFLDTMADADLLQQSPAPTTSFGGHCVSLTNIATAVSATARNIYRLFSGVWRYCGTLPDNTTAIFTDDKADDELGRPFAVGGFLTGITATDSDIVAGEIGRLHVVRTDAAAVAALAARLGSGSDGVQEGPIIDEDELESDALAAACDARIAKYGDLIRDITFRSRDVDLNEGPGKNITINLGGTTSISGTFEIQTVVTTEYHKAEGLMPLRVVTAGPVHHTLRDAFAA